MPPAQLHWMLADRKGQYSGRVCQGRYKKYMKIHSASLTNNPPFEYHRINLNNYLNVTAGHPQPRFCRKELVPAERADHYLPLEAYSQGMGGIGLPGDYSSASRFVKAAFLKWNSVCESNEEEKYISIFSYPGQCGNAPGSSRPLRTENMILPHIPAA